MSAEITIILKDESRTYRHKFLEYREFQAKHDDPVVEELICEARKSFEGNPTDIQVRISIEVI